MKHTISKTYPENMNVATIQLNSAFNYSFIVKTNNNNNNKQINKNHQNFNLQKRK